MHLGKRAFVFICSFVATLFVLYCMFVPTEYLDGRTFWQALIAGSQLKGEGVWWAYSIFPVLLFGCVVASWAALAGPYRTINFRALVPFFGGSVLVFVLSAGFIIPLDDGELSTTAFQRLILGSSGGVRIFFAIWWAMLMFAGLWLIAISWKFRRKQRVVRLRWPPTSST